VSINRFCLENSNGIPIEILAKKIELFSFLTDVRYIKGYIDEDIWVDPEFDINSKLVSDTFGCTLLLGVDHKSEENIVTIGHFMFEEFGYKSIKISLK
jgi:hypothetical protein